MNARERIEATLERREHDRVPFVCLDGIMPRGDLELSLRQRGMGLVLPREIVWCEYPHVQIETESSGDIQITTYHTPVGTLSRRQLRQLGPLPDSVCPILDGFVKSSSDWEAARFMATDAIFHVDTSAYNDTEFEIGGDGLVRCQGPRSPLELTLELYGGFYGALQARHAMVLWNAERRQPKFDDLLQAIEYQQDRYLEAIISSPVRWISLGQIDGMINPGLWEESVLPFYERIVPRLHEAGKIVSLHAHSTQLKAFWKAIAATKVDVVEAITPPPSGDLSLEEARQVFDGVLWLNLPAALLWWEPDAVRAYMLDLVQGDPHPEALMVGFTEKGLLGIVDKESNSTYRRSIKVIMDTLSEVGCLT